MEGCALETTYIIEWTNPKNEKRKFKRFLGFSEAAIFYTKLINKGIRFPDVHEVRKTHSVII